jgi:translation initiation factor IF-3
VKRHVESWEIEVAATRDGRADGIRAEDHIAYDRSPRRDDRVRTNERIRVREIRVIDDTGQQLGIMPPPQALAIARQKGLDLVEISPTAVPPVCRIMDFGKYQYQEQ